MLSGTLATTLLKSVMQAEYAKLLPAGDDWVYEPCFNGERVLAIKEDGGVRLHTVVHPKDVTNRFPVVAALVARLPVSVVVLEATVCAIDTWQQDAFAPSQSLSAPPFGSATMRLIATDILWRDVFDLRQCPLEERKTNLCELVAGTAALQPLPLSGTVTDIVTQARRLGADAVVAKRGGSRYRPFGRSGDWVRVNVDALAGAAAGSTADALELARQ